MKYGEAFAEYVRILSENEDTFACAATALTALWDAYHIARMEMVFQVSSTPFTPNGFKINGDFSVKDQIANKQITYMKTFQTGEGGTVDVCLYGGEGYSQWTEEEQKDLEVILNVFFFHCGRYRLINVVAQSIMTDSMTGLPNTQGFLRRIEKVFQQQRITQYNGYYFNLKRFSLMNKKFGKDEADAIICRYAKILRDFINEDEYVGRLGGDNFVALIKKERTQEFIELLSGVKTYGMLGDRESAVILSAIAGIYEIDDSIQHYEQVISSSAVAMNIAKNVTKQPFVYVTKELNDRVEKEKQIVGRFAQALKNQEFQVYYQPKVETDTYAVVGAEALVRWQHKGELISPREFIPVIERDGSVCNLDFYMLEKVCADIADWKNRGIEPVRISVNFSRKHLSNPEFAERIVSLLEKYHVEPRYIEVEVTETTDEEEQGLLSAFMNRMQESQIAVAIDDFGTGYSSLNILRTFPVEVLKIDKSFIDNGNHTENDHIVLSNIIHMAKQLNMDVVTEGVENWEQVEFLHDMECNIVQGFLFDKPMPKENFEQRIQNKRYDITQVVDYVE